MRSMSSPSFSPWSIFLVPCSAFYLICSTCVSSLLPQEGDTIPTAMADTFAFHASHYYILISTQILVSFGGITPTHSFATPSKIIFPFEMYEVRKLQMGGQPYIILTCVGLPLLESTSSSIFARSRVHSAQSKQFHLCCSNVNLHFEVTLNLTLTLKLALNSKLTLTLNLKITNTYKYNTF